MKDTQKISLWFGGAALLSGLMLLSVYSLAKQSAEADTLRFHTYQVLGAAEEFLSSMKDAETGQRGYLLTGDEAYLEPYLAVRDTFASELARLRELTQIVPLQQQRIPVLAKLSDAKLANLNQSIELRRRGDVEGALQAVRSGQGNQLMNKFRSEMRQFIELENELLAQRDARYRASQHRLLLWIAILGMFSVLAAAMAAYVVFRETHRRLLVKEQAALLLKQKNFEMEQLNAKLRDDDEQLQEQHRKTLETRERMVLIEKMSSLGTMVGGVAHEINNPLMGIMNYVEFARDNAVDAKSKEVLDNALHEINRIKKIVQNMLVFVRVDNSPEDRCNMAEAVMQTTALLDGEIKKHVLQLQIDLPEGMPQVRCSSGSLQQVLVNLLLNARDAVAQQDDRRIIIRAEQVGGKVMLSVCDNGAGVSDDVRHKIFVPFFTTKPVGKGTGLGLAVSRQLLEQVGGSLRLHDEQGFGACFRLELEVAEQTEQTK